MRNSWEMSSRCYACPMSGRAGFASVARRRSTKQPRTRTTIQSTHNKSLRHPANENFPNRKSRKNVNLSRNWLSHAHGRSERLEPRNPLNWISIETLRCGGEANVTNQKHIKFHKCSYAAIVWRFEATRNKNGSKQMRMFQLYSNGFNGTSGVDGWAAFFLSILFLSPCRIRSANNVKKTSPELSTWKSI